MTARSAQIIACALLLACGCTGKPPQPEDGKLLVVATTGPVGDLVRNIVGENAKVVTLMGPGVDPHLYRGSPSDIEMLGRADVIFYNGLHLEGRIGDTLERLQKKKPVFAVTQPLEDQQAERKWLLMPEGFEGHADPHVWHNVHMWGECAPFVASKMAEADSANADSYKQAGEAYQRELDALDVWCKEQIATIPEPMRVLITAHDAFAYFGKQYGIETVGLKGISTEDEVDPRHMIEVIDLVVERKAPCVFVETAVAPQIMQALAEPCRAKGHSVFVPQKESQQLYADALGRADSDAASYVGMIRANVRTIVAGLKGELH